MKQSDVKAESIKEIEIVTDKRDEEDDSDNNDDWIENLIQNLPNK